MRALVVRSSLWPLLVLAPLAACGRQQPTPAGEKPTAATAPAPSGGGGDMQTAANCPPSKKPEAIVKSPEQMLAERRVNAEKDLATFCGKLANDAVAGKPLPTGVAKLDEQNGINLDAAAYRKAIDDAANRVRLCRAVLTGSCDGFPAASRDKCDEMVDFYRAAKRAPADKSFRFTAWQEEHFRTVTGKPELVAAYAKAVRTRDPASCPKELAFCPAMATLDAKKCAGSDVAGCKRDVARYALVEQGGLQKLSEAGTPDEKLRARAALGKLDACDADVDQLRRACGDLSNVTPSLRVVHAANEPPRAAPNK